MTLIAVITIFILAVFVGLEVISKVPQTLHTPLMSATNAIHGVILVGGIVVLGHAHSTVTLAVGFVAVVFGTLNVLGGFVVTDRMLEMFKGKRKKEAKADVARAN
ncbi:MAG: NAD(P) transhydrogenase subunit alpha [Fimbriimonadaceae bacterium]|nr:MAG: NAD(P) transhydrogenase subunit alpha [Armatimonadetes bacterium OLB18]RIK01645.1 MAG: pyridine nucleotide transhydrogenase [Armatimonadota bacterium]WKZ80255.1 MAG: NAD(P) transhydrogenase subunit alpha [Fimbriimonadaceae bacterium]